MKRTKLPEKNVSFDLGVSELPGKGLSGRFIISPFTILRAMDGDWQKRKRQWISLGIKSEIGRGESLKSAPGGSARPASDYSKSGARGYGDGKAIPGTEKEALKGLTWQATGFMKDIIEERGGGTSIFDPVLCELMYAWFCPKEGQVVDPFAGGSVRGIVSVYMGRPYWGCDLSEKQILANRVQGEEITPDMPPEWVIGDSMKMLRHAPKADFVFSCPPYGDLEVYSDQPEDISNMEYQQFLEAYRVIIRKACMKLKDDRFACFVVGNFRDKKTGMYHDLVGDTVRAFTDAGLGYYNEAVFVTPGGSLPVRAGRVFASGRKLGKTHQNILIFYKGDPSKIKDNFDES